MISKELQKYYESRAEMACSDGWKDLMLDVKEMLDATDTLSGVTDEKTLHFRRGEISIMRWLLNLAEVSEKAYEGLRNESS